MMGNLCSFQHGLKLAVTWGRPGSPKSQVLSDRTSSSVRPVPLQPCGAWTVSNIDGVQGDFAGSYSIQEEAAHAWLLGSRLLERWEIVGRVLL